jgi:hypothetical protein
MDLSDWLNFLNLGPEEDGDSSEPAGGDSDAEWEWDQDSFIQAKNTGLELYLQLRDRLTTLTIPAWSHNKVIEEMMHTHDAALITDQVLCATLVYTKIGGVKAMEITGDDVIGAIDTTDDKLFE